MIEGDLLSFDLRPHVVRREDFVVLEIVGKDGKIHACKWHLDAGRTEVSEALYRLAEKLVTL